MSGVLPERAAFHFCALLVRGRCFFWRFALFRRIAIGRSVRWRYVGCTRWRVAAISGADAGACPERSPQPAKRLHHDLGLEKTPSPSSPPFDKLRIKLDALEREFMVN
ncbi:MAG: hypothetical protein EAZ43_04605 [Betaproteobacteria bacterium]|nr:MAG: hypothetical protein EAZ43_04605 [Betaproteobacteria bacterium]